MIDRRVMWGITLIDSAGRQIDHVVVEAPFESLRDRCRRLFESRADAAQVRLGSEDEGFEYVYPEKGG
jgi:hypothetical protein